MSHLEHQAHTLLAAYVLDAVDRDERAAVDAHLAECADCRADAAALRETVADLAEADAEAPPRAMRDAVLGRVAQTPQLPPTVSQAPSSAPARRRPRRTAWLVAAAAVAVTGIGAAWGALGGDSASRTLERDVIAVASAPDAHTMELALGDSHLVMSDRMDEVAVMGHAAPMPAHGMEYQLWFVLQDGSYMAGPTFVPDDDGDVMTLADLHDETIMGFTVTEEPMGGSEAPTGDMVAEVSL